MPELSNRKQKEIRSRSAQFGWIQVIIALELFYLEKYKRYKIYEKYYHLSEKMHWNNFVILYLHLYLYLYLYLYY